MLGWCQQLHCRHTQALSLSFPPSLWGRRRRKSLISGLCHATCTWMTKPTCSTGSENTGWNAVPMELRSSGIVIPYFLFWERQLYTHWPFNLALSPRPSGKTTSLSVPQSLFQFAMQKLSQSCSLTAPSCWFCAGSNQEHCNCYRRQDLCLDHSFLPNYPLYCDKAAQRCSGV